MLKIGILQSAGIAGNIIERALNHPEQDEIFVPVIYSKENQNDKNVGSDLKFGNIEAVVVAPGSSKEFTFAGSMTIAMDGYNRVTTVLPDAAPPAFESAKKEENVPTEGDTTAAEEGSTQAEASAPAEETVPEAATTTLTASELERCIRTMWHSMHRDFLISLPRIAVMATGDEEMDADLIAPLIHDLSLQGIGVFGPFALDSYLEAGQHLGFDVTMAIDSAQAEKLIGTILPPTYTKFIAGIPMVMASTAFTAATPIDEDDLSEPAEALRNAVCTCMEVVRHHESYDAAHRCPLPKLYHERRDESEKSRFAIKKPFITEKS